MTNPISTAAILRIYCTRPVTGICGCCGVTSRIGVVDLDRQCPVCRDCIPSSIQAAEALRAAKLFPPDNALVELDP